jgi:catechol 2,3-dioxygenase-like lactoylglutathione lyase family enzyme
MTKEETSALVSATPVLPSLDIERTVAFYCETLGFEQVHASPREYGIVERGPVELHFWSTDEAALPKASGCRIEVTGIDGLYSRCQAAGVVHPNGGLADKPWGTREFAILDPDGNLLTFHQSTDA